MLFQTSRTYFLLWNGKLDILKWRHIWLIFSQVVGTGDFQLANNIHKECYIPNLWKSYNGLFSQIHLNKYIIYICNALSLKQKIFKGNIKQFNAAAQSCSHAFYLHRFFFTLLFLYGPLEHVTHISLESPCTGSRLQLASSSIHWCLHIEQPQAQHPPTSTHWWQSTSPPEAWDLLVSDASWCHHREAQNHVPEHFHSPFLAGRMIFPPLSGMLSPWQFPSNTWKLISSVFTWQLLL